MPVKCRHLNLDRYLPSAWSAISLSAFVEGRRARLLLRAGERGLLDSPQIVLVETAVLAAYRLPVEHGGDLARLLLVHELHPAVFILNPLVPAHFLAAPRYGGVLGREVYAADLSELLQQMPHLRARVGVRRATGYAPRTLIGFM